MADVTTTEDPCPVKPSKQAAFLLYAFAFTPLNILGRSALHFIVAQKKSNVAENNIFDYFLRFLHHAKMIRKMFSVDVVFVVIKYYYYYNILGCRHLSEYNQSDCIPTRQDQINCRTYAEMPNNSGLIVPCG